MTVREWIEEYGETNRYSDFCVAYNTPNEDGTHQIIVDDRLAYIWNCRSEEYNKHWMDKCLDKQIVHITSQGWLFVED